MHIYFSGIGGVGLGPLAEISRQLGEVVSGSDLSSSPTFLQLRSEGFDVSLDQSGKHIADVHSKNPIDWFVYTAALPEDHPELRYAKTHDIKASKRDDVLKYFIEKNGQKLIAIAGTHGKTTTTAMVVWLFKQLDVAVSYLVGAPMSWGPSGNYDKTSEYFIYECDEFDRNFLQFHPFWSAITSIGYDHPDTYPTKKDYNDAFDQFKSQCQHVISWNELQPLVIQLAGAHNRSNGALAVNLVHELTGETFDKLSRLLESFPGTSRRFEKLGDRIYSDYAHHPDEIAATLELASELSNEIVVVYQPHQNIRQHSLDYAGCFDNAEKIYWLPTYLSREDPTLAILNPQQLTHSLDPAKIVYAQLDDELWRAVVKEQQAGKLIILMGAGSIDVWARQHLA